MTDDSVTSIFICYAVADRGWVHGYLLPALRDSNVLCTTRDDFKLGDPISSAFEDAVIANEHTILVLSPAFLADDFNGFATNLASYQRVVNPERRIIPLQLKAADLRLSLDFLVRLDYTNEANWDAMTARLLSFLKAPVPAISPKPDCPYPGMKPFSRAGHFYGREKEIAALVQRVRDQRQIFVVGASGSGKSSLVFAGLIPELQTTQAHKWVMLDLRPGEAPAQLLFERLQLTTKTPSNTELIDSVDTLLRKSLNAEKILLIVDQLEECFTQAASDEQQAFFAALKALAGTGKCTQVFTLSAEAYAEFQASPLFSALEGQLFDLTPLSNEALRTAIIGPASDLHVYIDEVLVERLIHDADSLRSPGYLPLLQETMIRLWDDLKHRWLPLSSYELLGKDGKSGLAVAIALKADATLEALGKDIAPVASGIARRVFLRLIQFGDSPVVTHRRQTVDQLRGEHDDPAVFDKTIRYLRDNRLLTADGDDNPIAGKIVSISHQKLIEQWPTCQTWIESGRAAELQRRELLHATAKWRAHPTDASFLYTGTRLQEYLDWRDTNPDELDPQIRNFLKACVDAQNEAARILRTRTLVLGVIAVAGLLLMSGFINRALYLEALRQQAIAVNPQVSIEAQGSLSAFSMNRYEVSFQQYQLCIDAGGCEPLNVPMGPPRQPVTSITPYDAAAFCRWVDQRLPSRDEWLAAAVGQGIAGEQRDWPWGAEKPSRDLVNAGFGEPMPEASVNVDDALYAGGDTGDGLRHMVGNVREWTTTVDAATCPAGETCPAEFDGITTLQKDVKLFPMGFSFRTVLYDDDRLIDDRVSFIGAFDHIGFRCVSGS